MNVKDFEKGSNKNEVMNASQFTQNYSHMGEMRTNMTAKGRDSMLPKPADHYMALVEHKIIDSTKRTERRNEAPPAAKAFSTLAKSGYKGMPNNHGGVVAEGIYKEGAQRGKRTR